MIPDYRSAVAWLTAGLIVGAVAVPFAAVVYKPASPTITSAEPPPLPIIKKKYIRTWGRT
jgi:hypothetical protein